MTCEEVKSVKYQTRKSPPFHANQCNNLKKPGKDGDYVSKPDSKGVYKWIKDSRSLTRKTSKKSYLIHNNGTRPFRVDVSGKSVEIYKKTGDAYSELVKKVTVKEVHLGRYEGAFGLGNSILLHLSGRKYMHIGFDIYEFTMEDDFEAYYSLIGNSDVPYPVLLGSKYVYFMLDYIYLPRGVFKVKMSKEEWEDAYQYFYGYKDYETGNESECRKKKPAREADKCRKANKEKINRINEAYGKKFKGLDIINV